MNQVQILSVPGAGALRDLERLRQMYPRNGQYPVLLGGAEDYERIEEGIVDTVDVDVASILAASRLIDPKRWAAARAEKQGDDLEEGEWPSRPVAPMGVITHLDILTRQPLPEVKIGLFKLSEGWEVFAHLGWGNWNACPAPEEHCAFHRDWFERFGSEVVSVTGAVVQCLVARPPTSRDAALKLAREQYDYCPDIVEQGTETLANLAASLLNAGTWYFWWD